MKPTREQIEAWKEASADSSIEDESAWSDGEVQAIAELAYAAGRKAGMEEASALCDIEVASKPAGSTCEYAKGYSMGAYVCANAVRAKLAAMEADK